MAQEMDGGLTHTSESNDVRTWDFEWTAPADDSQFVDFKIHGNAVNGGDGFNGDMWNSFETTIANVSHILSFLRRKYEFSTKNDDLRY